MNTQESLTPERVVEQTRSPRSYIVETPTGRVRHTRHHLHVRSGPTAKNSNGSDVEEAPRVIETRLKTGTLIRPLDWLQLLYSGDLLREEIFANQAILLSEEIFAIFDFNLPGDFVIFNLQPNRTDIA